MLKKKTPMTSIDELPGGDDIEVHVIRDLDESREVIVPEAVLHDIGRWPHLYDEEMREYMFPTAVAAPEVEYVSPEDLDEYGKLHRRWAAQLREQVDRIGSRLAQLDAHVGRR